MTISEVCEKYGLSQDTLRYYEKIGLISKIGRTSGGFREYTELDCQRLLMIKLMRTAGMSIAKILEYVDMLNTGDETSETRKHILIEQRNQLTARIEELQDTLKMLNKQIEENLPA